MLDHPPLHTTVQAVSTMETVWIESSERPEFALSEAHAHGPVLAMTTTCKTQRFLRCRTTIKRSAVLLRYHKSVAGWGFLGQDNCGSNTPVINVMG
jgi:hypothetical protein